ncbi:MAG: glycoside hydrolase family 2 TIM barrel-domain containing protein [Polyangiaceae bacterium]
MDTRPTNWISPSTSIRRATTCSPCASTTPENSSRWYPGAGIYRNTWLVRHHAVHVAPQGLFVHTPRVTREAAVIDVDVVIENELHLDVEVTLETSLFERDSATGEPSGSEIVLEQRKCPVSARGFTQQTVCTTLKTPKLWSLEARNRYLARTRVLLDGIEVDQVTTSFGVRSARFDAERGFLLNEEPVRLQGVCMHHDLGALGTAISRRALERQLEILLEMGVNSIRTSHNPPAPELLDLCDDLGILLMVEAFDCWERGKKTPEGITEGQPGFRYFDYAVVFKDWYEPDLRAMVRRARNHPSVVVYSIGNEVIEQWYPDGYRWATALAGIVREEDRTRAITAGCNGEVAAYRGFQTAVDVMGFNYKPDAYPRLKERNPTLCMVGTETASTISTRGEYFFPVVEDPSHGRVDFQVSSYDLSTPPWAFTPDAEFKGLDEAPYVAGEYVWTGFDYLGEPTPYNSDVTNLLNYSSTAEREKHRLELEQLGKIRVPSRSSYFGIIDLAGFPKDRFYLYQSRWRPELPMAHILPHWNWPERIGQTTPVHVYGSGDEAELFLNGRSLGVRTRGPGQYRFRWDDVTYEPGRLEVRTKKAGKPWANAVRETTGEPVALRAKADRTTLNADGSDLAFVTVSVIDREGRVVPRTNPLVRCHVEGAGEFVAMDNGDPTSLVAFSSKERALHQGLLLVILRTTKTSGDIHVTVSADGLESATLVLSSR